MERTIEAASSCKPATLPRTGRDASKLRAKMAVPFDWSTSVRSRKRETRSCRDRDGTSKNCKCETLPRTQRRSAVSVSQCSGRGFSRGDSLVLAFSLPMATCIRLRRKSRVPTRSLPTIAVRTRKRGSQRSSDLYKHTSSTRRPYRLAHERHSVPPETLLGRSTILCFMSR